MPWASEIFSHQLCKACSPFSKGAYIWLQNVVYKLKQQWRIIQLDITCILQASYKRY